MIEGSHSMTLEEYAQAAQLNPPPRHPDGPPIIVTPALARALNTLIETADEVIHESAGTVALIDALDQLQALHDYSRRRLGGLPR